VGISVALDLTFLRITRGNAGRNVKSATLARNTRGGRDKRNLGDQLLDDGAAERAEVLGYQNEGTRSADHIVLIIFFETAGRICVLGIPGYRPIAENDETIDDNSLGERLVAGELHVAAGIVGGR
jgi:hypothetical protein